MAYIDTHAHLDAEEYDDCRDDVLRRALRGGVDLIVCPAISASSSEAAVRLAEKYASVHAAVGIQPNHTAEAAPGDWDRVVRLASHPRVVAVGETGLDRHWDFAPFDLQRDYFDRHLHLAQKRDLPVIVHCREAEDDLLPMLEAARARGAIRGVLHAFSGDPSFARACLDLGLHVSFAGAVTYTNKKFGPLRAAAAIVPLDRLLLETDSPYLIPHPLRGKQKRNEPTHIVHTAKCLADLREIDLEAFARRTTENARRLFRLPRAFPACV